MVTVFSRRSSTGALFSVITFFACIAPTTKFYLFAVLPVPAWLLVSGVFLVDGFSAVYDKVSLYYWSCEDWDVLLSKEVKGFA